MHKRYIGRAPTDATPEQLRALFERRQTARAEADERKHRRDTRSDASGSRTGGSSSGSTNEGSGSTSGGSTSGGSTGSNTGGSSYRGRDGRSYSSDRNKSDPFSSRRPPPIEEDFEAVGSKRGVPFEEARQAYKDAARKNHPDAGGDPEVMKRINAAWDRIRRSYGR
jgi:hypothetical protein